MGVRASLCGTRREMDGMGGAMKRSRGEEMYGVGKIRSDDKSVWVAHGLITRLMLSAATIMQVADGSIPTNLVRHPDNNSNNSSNNNSSSSRQHLQHHLHRRHHPGLAASGQGRRLLP